MSEAFDPYYKWLGIPRKDQPPNHYRLLGIEPFESDADVITHAADQRMGHLKAFQAGKHSVATQQLLNQIAAAKLCLLDDESRRIYDEKLRGGGRATAGQSAPQRGNVAFRPANDPSGPSAKTAVRFGPWHVAAGAGLLLTGWAAWVLWSGGIRPEADNPPSLDDVSSTVPDAVPAQTRTTTSPAAHDDGQRGADADGASPTAPRSATERLEAPSAMSSNEDAANDTVAPQNGDTESAEHSAATRLRGVDQPGGRSAETTGDAESWVELKQRRSAAVAAGDFHAAMETITRMGALRQIDMLNERAEALEQCRAALDESTPREVRRELARDGIELLRAAVAAHRADLVDRLGNPVLQLARGLDDVELVHNATLLIVELQHLGGGIPPQPPPSIAENEGP